MSSLFYPKLALTNIKNNRKTYIPYMLTCIITVMMYLMMDALSRSKCIGDGALQSVLSLSVGVIMVFAVIFLFYTNSFLMKRRKKELGVYNILGMEKRHIARVLSFETLYIAVSSLVFGLISGVVFSKLMFLILLKLLHHNVRIQFELPLASLMYTIILFVIIFVLTLLYNLFQIQIANPIELLRGGNQGEKEPKTKWLLTIFGIIMIGIGYYIAVTVEKPIAAVSLFFVAVICVILGTYALFVAGSVALLKMLRKNKKFYYKTNHFTSVSGMIYRMKQNAVGLANICILSTVVLVMISTTISLYTGMNDVLETRFPQEYSITKYNTTDADIDTVNKIIEEETKKHDVKIKSELSYRSGVMSGIKNGNKMEISEGGVYGIDSYYELHAVPLEDYNRIEKKNETLSADEVLIFTTNELYNKDSIQIGSRTFRVKQELKHIKLDKKSESNVVDGYYIIMADTNIIEEVLDEAYKNPEMASERLENLRYTISFDLDGSKKQEKTAMKSMNKRAEAEAEPVFCESRELGRESFYTLYGGLLFIGIYLGILFLMATVLIIYYKQISEGYDDKERYQIMQKVGMSRREVKKSIRSQILTVFFLPLVVAIIHIAVAFGVITKLLATLNLVNVSLFLTCTIITVIVFAIFYAIIFAITAREYYKIVH